jgi:hypothetical protein
MAAILNITSCDQHGSCEFARAKLPNSRLLGCSAATCGGYRARRLHEQADFPNLLMTIPGTPQS